MKHIRFLLAFASAVSSALASQGVALTPAQTLFYQVNNSAPYSGVTSTRVEVRLHGWSLPSGTANVFQVPQFQVRLMGTGYNAPLAVTDWLDYFPPGQSNTLYFDITGMSDVIIRVQRDAVANTLTGQVWNADGSGQVITQSLPIQAIVAPQLPTQAQVGDTLTNCILDYARWFSTTVAATTSPFAKATGDLADWEFDGTLQDKSGQNLQLAATMPPAFPSSPNYAPYATQGSQRVFRAGVPQVLDGTGSHALNGSNALSYKWSQVSGPTTLAWSNTASPKPTVTGLAFGSYVIQLQVTDSSGTSSTNVLKYGSVFTAANDLVIPPAAYITQVFGPMLRLGANPWPYFDSSHQAMADFFGGLQATDYQDVWNKALPGYLGVTNGSPVVVGVGTSFQSEFCGGGTAAANGATLVVWYPVPNSPGQFGRAPYGVVSCQSDTVMTLGASYNGTTAMQVAYAEMDNNSVGTWINGSNNANYYDNVMAFYNLYYRSGLDDYLTYARTLADRWYTMPWFDQGRASQNGNTFLFPRLQSLTGLILRAFDGHPEYWSGIELYVTADYGFANTPPADGYALNDTREQGYATAFLSMAAMFDPNATNRANYRSELTNMISTVWAPAAQSGGNWVNGSYGYATWNNSGGTVSVTNGSNVVTGSGTNWQPNWFSNNAVWTANPDGVSDGDNTSYTAVQVVSPTMLLLDKPYQGPSQSGRGWQSSNLVGVGTQPFMLGVAGQGFRYALMATGDTRLPGYIAKIASWLSTEGYRPDSRGLWYGRTFANCEPIAATNEWCSGGAVEPSRFLAGEIVGLLSSAYMSSLDPSVKAFGDNVYGAMFGGPTGGPESDETYVTDIAPGGWAMQVKYAKDFGFFFGFGGGPSWPAARLIQSNESPRPR